MQILPQPAYAFVWQPDGAFAAQQPQHHAWGWGFPVHRACICRGQLCGWSVLVPSGLPWVYDIVRMHVYVHVEVVIGDAPCVDDVWRCLRMRDRALSGRERRDVDMHWRESDRVSVRDNDNV